MLEDDFGRRAARTELNRAQHFSERGTWYL